MSGPSATENDVEMARPEPAMLTSQPVRHQAMDAQKPHADTENTEPELGLRGGGETCPGRFCFIIPCPIPINCCIFPCPC
ncbi:hypothetical protein CCM_08128 [Cordyceps militaris CM01]|uniref:Uncharacterized protein n=1 Tax=Cordyceps militaris (strain CM01) TaxID=983644 RepID=G3JNN5_CORMM|nr:uncharacterized protein CCM_08128 [Cordyceps militaris CM01]EGX89875.1 hypothetical protein CCM_08128 [Cordyceps militaris CM01]